MIAGTVIMYLSSTVHWSLYLVYNLAQVDPQSVPSIESWNVVQASMLAINVRTLPRHYCPVH